MRCFIAAFLGADSARSLVRQRAQIADLNGVRWLQPETLHVTFAFLGEMDPSALAPSFDLIDAMAAEFPLSCRTRTLAGFPRQSRARVIAATVESSGRLESIARRFGADRFRAHVTLGRCKSPWAVPEGLEVETPIELPTMGLYRSETLPAGARYTLLDRLRLGL